VSQAKSEKQQQQIHTRQLKYQYLIENKKSRILISSLFTSILPESSQKQKSIINSTFFVVEKLN
jgi:hypothetical protein